MIVEDRFWAKVTKTEGCWVWTGATTSDGYGSFWLDGPKSAHRIAYELMVGAISPGLTIDHLCRNRACVNPSHLEPVTFAENIARRPNVTHCPQGHPYDETNTMIHADGKRRCGTCRRDRERIRRERVHV